MAKVTSWGPFAAGATLFIVGMVGVVIGVRGAIEYGWFGVRAGDQLFLPAFGGPPFYVYLAPLALLAGGWLTIFGLRGRRPT